MIAISRMPVYEKPNDRTRQLLVVNEFVKSMQTYEDLPHNFTLRRGKETTYLIIPCSYKYVIDYFITTDYGKVVSAVECKWYKRDWRDYDYHFPISVHKIKHLLQWGKAFNCTPFMLMRNKSGLHYLKIDESVLSRNKVKLYGRTDRNDPNDLEPMVFIEERYWDVYKVGHTNG